MTPGMKSAQEILARCLGQPGYIEHVREVGIINIETEADDLTNDQRNTLHVCINDPEIFGYVLAIYARYVELKAENKLSARPWYDNLGE